MEDQGRLRKTMENRSSRFDFRRLPWISLVFLVFAGCAVQQPPTTKPGATNVPTPVPIASHKPRQLIVFIPQTDDSIPGLFKIMAQHPTVRVVLAVSPKFARFKTPELKSQAFALMKSGRLELALQIPNAPFLPLLMDSNSAKASLPAGAELPTPPYAYPDDIIQIIATGKAGFFHMWNMLPRGIVLPHGAASPELLARFDHLGIAWMVAAFSAPAADGPYKAYSYMIWDATPAGKSQGTVVHVWDDREMKDATRGLKTVEGWVRASDDGSTIPILPSDPIATPLPNLPANWAQRTWMYTDWSRWIGSPQKNAAWNALRKTRAALESYKNSGQASIRRLDACFEEIYTAQNSSFLEFMDNPAAGTAAEERHHDFEATLSTVFRLMGKATPDDLFETSAAAAVVGGLPVQRSTTTATGETLPDGTEHVVLTDAAGDEHGQGKLPTPAGAAPGTYDLRTLDVRASANSVDWTITLGAMNALGASGTPGPMIDIYVDLNNQPGVGTQALLPGRGLVASPADAWEFALALSGHQATLYRTQTGGTYSAAGTFPITLGSNGFQVSIPRALMRGNPVRWGYQIIVMAVDPHSPPEGPQPLAAAARRTPPAFDVLDPLDMTQADVLGQVAEGDRSDIPFVRIRK